MEAGKTNLSPTLEAIFTELREKNRVEGREEGKKEVFSTIIRGLANENFSNAKIS